MTNTATAEYPGLTGTFLDAIPSGLIIRYQDDGEWTIASGMVAEAPQFNLIGYSYGSLLAAQTAWSYARNGHLVDHLVLIGSPIDADFLANLRRHRRIGKVIVIDLTQHGDPIYAGMSQAELLAVPQGLLLSLPREKEKGTFTMPRWSRIVRAVGRRWRNTQRFKD
uniref:thioesterase domain-containing protein n=1 Tax=Cupriavidus taiwanensis TaxID=164546 RepID=UPI001F11C523|nr:thioesterase domain-containing protein [Cupriavidus taiwanensis]